MTQDGDEPGCRVAGPNAIRIAWRDGKVDLKEATSFTEQGWGYADQAGAGKIKRETLPDFFQPSFASAKVDAEGFVTKEAYIAAVPDRFKAADANGDLWLSREEFATTRPKEQPKPKCRC
jgi:hypothetical protein